MALVMRLAARVLAALAFGALATAPLSAHSSPNSELRLSPYGDHVAIDLVMPASDYIAASGKRLSNDPDVLKQAAAVLEANLTVQSAGGRIWQVRVDKAEMVRDQGPPDLRARFRAVPPDQGSVRSFQLDWGLFSPDNPGALVMVVLAQDPAGTVGSSDAVLGAISQSRTTLSIDLGTPNPAAIAMNAFLIGAHHILEGYDHLLFLLALMLPAPLLAINGRWRRPRSPGGAARRIVLTVTAFTLGHSVTLVVAAIWPIPVSAVIVESMIAMSVLISALHAIRPIFAANEPAIGGAFGLVHGLAFATLLNDSVLGGTIGAASLIGFTLGIEAIQLALVACAMPALILLAPQKVYAPLRTALGAAILLIAVLWLVNRLFGIAEGPVAAFEAAMSVAFIPLAGLLVIVAAMLLLLRHRSQANVLRNPTHFRPK